MTNYRDTIVTCRECGKRIFFTVEKQRQLAERGEDVTPPEMCSECLARIKYGGKLHGRIKWFDAGKGFGFLAEDSGEEIFVHCSGVRPNEEGGLPTLEDGQDVLYKRIDTPKGPQAVEVEPMQR
jgi:CspA family cold shock protein